MSLIHLFSSTRVFAGPTNPLDSDSPVMHDIVVLILNIMKKVYCKILFLNYSRAVITAALRFFFYHQSHVSLDCDVYSFYQKFS